MRRSAYDQQRVAEIIARNSAGDTIQKISQAEGVSEQTIYRWKAKFLKDSQETQQSTKPVPKGSLYNGEPRSGASHKGIVTLQTENASMRDLIAELVIENHMLRKKAQ